MAPLIMQIWARSGFDGDQRVLKDEARPSTNTDKVGASHNLKGDSRNCVPRSLPWRESFGLRVADSHTGNHCEDGFTPLKTIRRFSSIIWEKIPFKLEGEASEPERRGRTLKSGKNKINFFKIPESPRRVKEETKNDIGPVAPTNAVSRLILEWEERFKLHREKEMEFNQWRSKVFNDGRPAFVNEGCEVSEEEGIA
ncbi:hypothetical protein Tco_0786423 [Tanacetum coccineum]